MMRVDRALCTENASKMHRCKEFIFYEYMVFGDVCCFVLYMHLFGFVWILILISLHLIRRPINFVDALSRARR